MSGAFMQILWGMLFVIIDIKFEWFDVALDAIGYFMIVTALTRLAPASASFGTARAFAVAAGIVSLPAMMPIEPFQPFWALQTLFDLFLVWFLCNGIVELANARANGHLATNAVSVRTLNVLAFVIVIVVTGLSAMTGHRDTGLLAVPALLFGLTSGVVTLLLLRRASVEFA